jgi:hypothetical protein
MCPNISTVVARIMANSPIAIPTTDKAAIAKNKCTPRRCQIPTKRVGRATAVHQPINKNQIAVIQLMNLQSTV